MEMVGGSGSKGKGEDPNGGGGDPKFADYLKFDDLFGASSLFTTGTKRMRKKQTEQYVKLVMERQCYGYVHQIHSYDEPIERVAIGAGCAEDELEGIDNTAKAALTLAAAGGYTAGKHSADKGDHTTSNPRARKKPRITAGGPGEAGAQQLQQQQHQLQMLNGRAGGGGGGGGGRPSDVSHLRLQLQDCNPFRQMQAY